MKKRGKLLSLCIIALSTWGTTSLIAQSVTTYNKIVTLQGKQYLIREHVSADGSCGTATIVPVGGEEQRENDVQLRGDAEKLTETIRLAVVTHENIHLSEDYLQQRSDSLSAVEYDNGVSAKQQGAMKLVATGLTFNDSTFSTTNTTQTRSEAFRPSDHIRDNELAEIVEHADPHIIVLVVPDNWSGPLDNSSIRGSVFTKKNWQYVRPVVVIKEWWFKKFDRDALMHGILHTMRLHAQHENAPKGLTNKPFASSKGPTIGAGGVGGYYISGGTPVGVGPDGENMAEHQREVGAIMLDYSPNLHVTISAPDSTTSGEPIDIDFAIDKELADTTYAATITDEEGAIVYQDTSSHLQWTPTKPGTYHILVSVANRHHWQEAQADKDILVQAQPNQAPVAQCKSITVQVAPDSTIVVTADDIDAGSYDPDGEIVDKSIDGKDELSFNGNDAGDHSVVLDVQDDKGAHDQCNATITVEKTDANEDIAENEITLYPNPTDGDLILEGIDAHTIDEIYVYHSDGKDGIVDIVPHKQGNRVSIDTTPLRKGVYILTIVSKDGTIQSFKFIKE